MGCLQHEDGKRTYCDNATDKLVERELSDSPGINHLDLFSGIGGFSKGIADAGIKVNKHYFSEVDKNAINIYKRNFPGAINVGSITDVRGGELGRIDIITFGFPCQDLSIAGKRAGLGGARSGLFFEAVRLIQECRPKYFIAENVKGLFSSNGGKDFTIVLKTLTDLGLYSIEWQLLNSKNFGVPQNRERVFIIGHLGGEPARKVFPIESSNGQDPIELTTAECPTLTDPCHNSIRLMNEYRIRRLRQLKQNDFKRFKMGGRNMGQMESVCQILPGKKRVGMP
jgi:DNA (cytosine-5)-methyltransferase 1